MSEMSNAAWDRQANSTPALPTYHANKFSKSVVKSRAFRMALLIYSVFP
jgi:hypothetical protein